MQDLEIVLEHRPGSVAELGEALGAACVSIEGGGVFVTEGRGVARLLFADAAAARRALEAAGITVVRERDVLVQRLRQAVPGQLGQIARRMADAGVNIEVQYSDHDNQLILVVDDFERGQAVSKAWERESDWPIRDHRMLLLGTPNLWAGTERGPALMGEEQARPRRISSNQPS